MEEKERKVCCWLDQSEEDGHATLSIHKYIRLLYFHDTSLTSGPHSPLFSFFSSVHPLSFLHINPTTLFFFHHSIHSLPRSLSLSLFLFLFRGLPFHKNKTPTKSTKPDFTFNSVAVFHSFSTRWCTSNSNVFSSPCLCRSISGRKRREAKA